MIVLDEVKEKLTALAQPLVIGSGADLIELNVRRQGRDVAVQLLADRPTGGITLEECSLINRRMIEAIDQSGILPADGYTMEVSSPGLDRPLKTRKDFMRVVNLEVRFLLTESWQGKQEYTGVLTEITDTAAVVTTEKYGTIEIPIEKILKAYVVV